jgi:hydroxymethylpyrimidine/phosphomethylpyrimidine kinase
MKFPASSGLEADQRVLAAHGCYALTATTGLTAQNTLGVQDIFVVPAEFVKKQISANLDDVGTDVVKLGMAWHPKQLPGT